MSELLKLVWNFFVLRDSIRKGEMTGGAWLAALGFLATCCAIAVPAIVYYQRHPDADGTVFMYMMVALGVLLGAFYIWAFRRQQRLKREHANQDVK